MFCLLLLVMRLMGKRQIGEMEPFELVITLVISELACIPITDRSVPLTFGIVAILTLFLLHQLILIISKNRKMQGVISGKPVMVYDTFGINEYALDKLNMQVSDLYQALRVTEHFSFEEINYGILETNGQLTVVENKEMMEKQQTLPIPIIFDGHFESDDIERNNIDKEKIKEILADLKVKEKEVLLMTIDQSNRMSLQLKKKPIEFKDIDGEKIVLGTDREVANA